MVTTITPKSYDSLMSPFERRFLGTLRIKLLQQISANSEVLEIGAGTGANFPFYPKYRNLTASDASAKMLLEARSSNQNITKIQADATNLPFESESFDVVVATLVFCSISSPKDALTEVLRVLKPGAKFLLIEHVRPKGILGNLFDLGNLLTSKYFSENICLNTETLIKDAGFRLISINSYAYSILNVIVVQKP